MENYPVEELDAMLLKNLDMEKDLVRDIKRSALFSTLPQDPRNEWICIFGRGLCVGQGNFR